MILPTESEKKAVITGYEDHGVLLTKLRKNQNSHPLALSFGFIIAIGCVLVILSFSDGLLWQLAKNAGGFEISSANRYLLTYGPTAILVCVVAAWRQLDYYTKVITPWTNLSRGSAPAQRSVLLDYISVLQIVAWWKAISNKHYAVMLTTSGFALLKIAMLASTGLFVLKTSQLNYTIGTTLNTNLGSPLFNITNNVAVFDQSLFYTAYGVLVQNLDKPFGLGTRLAYSTFEVPEQLPKDDNFTVEVDAFVPSFECKPAIVDVLEASGNSSDPHPIVPYQITSPNCQLIAARPSLYALNPQLFRCPDKQLSGILQNINCSQSVFGTDAGVYKLLFMTDIRYSQTLDNDDQNAQISQSITASAWNTEIFDLTAVVCRLSYDQQRVKVSGASSGRIEPVVLETVPSAPEKQYDGFSPDDLDSLFRGALSASDEILGSRLDQAYSEEYPDPMFKAMSAYIQGSYVTLMNTSTMVGAAGEVATQLTAQIAHQYLRINTTRPLEVMVVGLTGRLEITTLAAWVVFGSLLSVAASCILLMLVRRAQWPRMQMPAVFNMIVPSVIADETLTNTLIASQSCHEKQLKDLLQSNKMYLLQGSTGESVISSDNEIDSQTLSESGQRWFVPVTISRPVMTITVVLALGLVIVLEVLQRLSNTHAGFLELPLVRNDTVDVLIRVVPALAAVLVASLFNCLDFNVLLLTPYRSMQSPMPLRYLYQSTLLSRTPLLGLWTSIRRGNLSAAFSTTAALTGSLLAIVVSGLFSAETMYSNVSAKAALLNGFEPRWQNSALNDQSAALLSSLIENLNFTFPRGTYGEFAIPSLEISQSQQKLMRNSSITALLPVWRADLQCSPLVSANISTEASNSRFNNGITVNATYGLSSTCPFGGSNGTDGFINFVHTFTVPTSENSSFVGKLLDLHVGPYDPIRSGAQGELVPDLTPDNPLGCPSLALVYGSVDFTTGKNKIVVDVCYQKLQKLHASIRFSDADLNIPDTDALIVDEPSMQYVQWDGQSVNYNTDVDSATSFQYRIQNHFDNIFVIFNSTRGNKFSKIDVSRPAIDPFFQGVFFGRSPLPLHLLQLQDNSDLIWVNKGIVSFYRRYMAQAISLNMRVPLSSTNETIEQQISVDIEQGKVQKRLVQNNDSKIVLQTMLSYMLLCGLVVCWRFKMHKLLPEAANPCTIWGQMSLWAGSKHYEQISKQVYPGDLSNLVQKQAQSYVQLGWWHLPDGQKRYGFEILPTP